MYILVLFVNMKLNTIYNRYHMHIYIYIQTTGVLTKYSIHNVMFNHITTVRFEIIDIWGVLMSLYYHTLC